MKKISMLIALVVALSMCFMLTAGAQDELTEGAFSYTVADGKATIVRVDTSVEDGLYVPTELGGYPVEAIDIYAFEGCENLDTVHFCGTQQDWDILTSGVWGMTLHLAEKVAETPARCEETGLTAGIRCDACDKWLVEQTETPVLGHSFTSYQSDNNATILADGTKTAYCDNGCGESDTVVDENSKRTFGKPEKVASAQSTSAIKLSWTSVEGATGYRVFYKVASGWKTCATTKALSHTFKNLKPASRYTFAVQAYNLTETKDGQVLTWAPVYSTFETSTKALAPAKAASSSYDCAFELRWSGSAGATGYRIYYKVGDVWKVAVSSTTKTSHMFKGIKEGAKYTLAIRPYIKTADTVIWSDYITWTVATPTATPYLSVKSNEGGSITFTWKAVAGADGYRLYYRKSYSGAYKVYGTYDSVKTVTISNLKVGELYDFTIQAGVRSSAGVIWSSYSEMSETINYRITRYADAIKSGNFYFEIHDGAGTYNGVAMKNGSYCLQVRSSGEKSRIVYNAKNNYCYIIDDSNKMYYGEKDDGTFKSAIAESISISSKALKYKTSTEKIGSKTYFVESYTQDGVTLKYYFNGATLVKEAYVYQGETIAEYYYSKFTKTVPDSLFSVPSGYKKVTA